MKQVEGLVEDKMGQRQEDIEKEGTEGESIVEEQG